MKYFYVIMILLYINNFNAEVFEKTYNFDDYFFIQSGYNVLVQAIEPRCLQTTPDGGYAILMEMDLDLQMLAFHGVALMKADQFGEMEWIKLLSYDPSLSFYEVALADINFGRGFVVNNNGDFVIPITSFYGGPIHGSYLINLSSEGEYNWVKTIREFYYPCKRDLLSSIKESSTGEYYAVGVLQDDLYYDKLEIVKFNEFGDTLWMKTFIDSTAFSARAFDLEMTNENEIIVTGTFDCPYIPSVFKIDAQGEIIWRTTLNSEFNQQALISITKQSGSSSFLLGYNCYTDLIIDVVDNMGNKIDSLDFLATPSFDPVSIVQDSDMFVFAGNTDGDSDINCSDLNGNIIWQFDKDNYGIGVEILQITSDGNFAVISVQGLDNLILTKFDENGNYTNITNDTIIFQELYFNFYPNPFNPTTTISFSIPADSKVGVSIYNVKGQKVKTLVNDELEKGLHKIIWDSKDNSGKSVSSGVYFYKLNVNGKDKAVRKCLLLK